MIMGSRKTLLALALSAIVFLQTSSAAHGFEASSKDFANKYLASAANKQSHSTLLKLQQRHSAAEVDKNKAKPTSGRTKVAMQVEDSETTELPVVLSVLKDAVLFGVHAFFSLLRFVLQAVRATIEAYQLVCKTVIVACQLIHAAIDSIPGVVASVWSAGVASLYHAGALINIILEGTFRFFCSEHAGILVILGTVLYLVIEFLVGAYKLVKFLRTGAKLRWSKIPTTLLYVLDCMSWPCFYYGYTCLLNLDRNLLVRCALFILLTVPFRLAVIGHDIESNAETIKAKIRSFLTRISKAKRCFWDADLATAARLVRGFNSMQALEQRNHLPSLLETLARLPCEPKTVKELDIFSSMAECAEIVGEIQFETLSKLEVVMGKEKLGRVPFSSTLVVDYKTVFDKLARKFCNYDVDKQMEELMPTIEFLMAIANDGGVRAAEDALSTVLKLVADFRPLISVHGIMNIMNHGIRVSQTIRRLVPKGMEKFYFEKIRQMTFEDLAGGSAHFVILSRDATTAEF
ncbi:hypothetical protein MPSEU_000823300 [Mayamaea pseudoterrestris]|nr:hypothetical protein MPSEU_000823300 [Mayamaea pseudoterrestris]